MLVLGAGKSGVSAVEFLRMHGAQVEVYDDKENCPQPEALEFDFCVISPGISITHPIAQQFCGRIVSELSLGFQTHHRKIVAVTGTNGKTTVVNMINEAVNSNRRLFARRGILCGNVGVPVTSVTKELRSKTAVTEVSSFMMDPDVMQDVIRGFKKFRPNIAVILNISQDHLERHGSMENYITCKASVAKHQRKKDYLVLNYDCENTRKLGECSGPQRVFYFSTKARVRGIYIDGKDVILNIKKYPEIIFSVADFEEEKPHQLANILATVLVGKLMHVSKQAILKACMGSRARENRIQHIGTVGQVMFFNDSKATNTAASLAACNCFKSPVHLLLGGLPKGQNFDELFKDLPPQVEQVFCFGASREIIEQAARAAGFMNITCVGTMVEAVRKAYETGKGPRVVLLSPACSSFDEFEDYQHRGRIFTEQVRQIEKEQKGL